MNKWAYLAIKLIPTIFNWLIAREQRGSESEKTLTPPPPPEKPPIPTILLTRFDSTEEGTFGELRIGDFTCYTVERPWEDNKPYLSCIPPGTYRMIKRMSGVVYDTTNEEFEQGWEICDVPGRSAILIHVANTADGVKGCVGVGDSLGEVYGKRAVMNSLDTFRMVMNRLKEDEYLIEIKEKIE